MTTTVLVSQQRGDLVATVIMADFGKFLRLHTADGDASPAAIRSYYGNAAQFVEAARLEGLQPVLASPYWRKDRHGQPHYLYLIHPTQGDGSRRREYIGADPEAQAEALARIEAHEKLVQVRTEIHEIDHRPVAITGHLARALRSATNGLVPYW
jgi:hypothetical protein